MYEAEAVRAPRQHGSVAGWAFGALGLFILLSAGFGYLSSQSTPAQPVAPGGIVVAVGVVAVLFHLALFPVVAASRVPGWAKAAGYGWLVTDIVSNIMAINGVADTMTTPLRLGGHIPAAIWIGTWALEARGAVRWTGLPLAIWLFAYSFLAPWVPGSAFMPAIVLMIGWLISVGVSLRRRGAEPNRIHQASAAAA